MSKQSTQEIIAEVWKLFRENEGRIQEVEAQVRETSAFGRETSEQLRRTDEQLRQTDEQLRQTDEQMRRMEGAFGIQWGRMLEALVQPAALALFRQRGIEVHYTYRRLTSSFDRRMMELDIVLENEDVAVVIEVKSLMRVEDVDDLIEDLGQIASFFTKYRGRQLFGALAGLEFADGVDRYAYRRGLFVLTLSGEGIVHIRNDPAFRPHDFGQERSPQ